ncbi:MAG: hypothetical protein R3B52_02415 [Candidatus Paceibacterota bacterium]
MIQLLDDGQRNLRHDLLTAVAAGEITPQQKGALQAALCAPMRKKRFLEDCEVYLTAKEKRSAEELLGLTSDL